MSESRASSSSTRVPASKPPHLPLLVGEVAAITSLSGWDNIKVQVRGRLTGFTPFDNTAVLRSVTSKDCKSTITINVELLGSCSNLNFSIVVIFGELDVINGKPLVIAKFLRECNTLNLELAEKADEYIRSRFPINLK